MCIATVRDNQVSLLQLASKLHCKIKIIIILMGPVSGKLVMFTGVLHVMTKAVFACTHCSSQNEWV